MEMLPNAPRFQPHVRPPRGVTHGGLPGPASLQSHQAAHRKDGGEEPGYAEREEYPNEGGGVGSGEGVGDACCPLQMEDRHQQRQE